MKIPFEKRQEILHHSGKITADLIDLFGSYPLTPVWLGTNKPELLLPYSKELILQSIDEELADPVAGAAIRGKKSVEEYCESLKAFRMVIQLEYIPNEDWLQKFNDILKKGRKFSEDAYLTSKK